MFEVNKFLNIRNYTYLSDIPLVYVAGPFSAKDRAGVDANIKAAEDFGIKVCKLGACPVIPHANTSRPEFEKIHPYEFWIEATKVQMVRCDAVAMMPNFRQSSGAGGEEQLAVEMGLPVLYNLKELERWISRERFKA